MFCFSLKLTHPVLTWTSPARGPLYFDADLHHRNERAVLASWMWTSGCHMAHRKPPPAGRSPSNQALRFPAWTQGRRIGGAGQLPQGGQAKADDSRRCNAERGGLSAWYEVVS